jgi:putative hemolysin
MTGLLLFAVVVLAAMSSVTGALGYALRDFSRSKLEDVLTARGKPDRIRPLLEHAGDFMLIAASVRLLCILLMFWALLRIMDQTSLPDWSRHLLAIAIAAVISTIFSVGLASSLAKYFGEQVIARLDPYLHALRAVALPLLIPLNLIDRAVFRISPASRQNAAEQATQEVQDELLAVVEEGQKEGAVDKADVEMIESVIQFRDTTTGQIMTARPEIVAVDVGSSLPEIMLAIEESGHSRLPVYENDLDHILGILYARDLLHDLSDLLHDPKTTKPFDLRKSLRQVNYVPESKPLKDLLQEFRMRKVHLAIVLDEFGGTAGLITIEDVLEELVGEISDEHEPTEPPAVHKINDHTWEIDARTYVEEVNAVVGLSLPEDQGYDTLGGYVSSVLGRIPERAEEFTTEPNIRWQVIDAEPTRVNRLRLSLETSPAR